jgi:hypothetical protein
VSVTKFLKTLTGRMLAGINRDVPITGEAYTRTGIAGLSPAAHADNWELMWSPYRGSSTQFPFSRPVKRRVSQDTNSVSGSSLPDHENGRTDYEIHMSSDIIPIMCGESRLPCDYREVGIASRGRPLKSVLTSTEPVGRDGKYVQLNLFDHQSGEDVQ